jgi:hypothetical protein
MSQQGREKGQAKSILTQVSLMATMGEKGLLTILVILFCYENVSRTIFELTSKQFVTYRSTTELLDIISTIYFQKSLKDNRTRTLLFLFTK